MKFPPMVKYTLARVGMFVIVAVALTPLHDLLLQLLISAVVTSIASLFLLRKWRDEVAGTLQRSMSQRRVEKDRLRSALAGDDDPTRTDDVVTFGQQRPKKSR